MTDLALRTYVEVTYRGVNITDDVSKDLIGFSYTDNESGTADDIDITLKNNHGRWSNEWLPTLGDKITATVKQIGRNAGPALACGSFTFDEYNDSEESGSGATVSFRCQSTPVQKNIKNSTKSRGWEQVKLSEIASDIANNGGLKLTYATSIDPIYDRKDQSNVSDLQFLKALCKDEALNLKITSDQIVIFDPQEMDKKSSIMTFTRGTSLIKSRSFTTQNHNVYSESTVEYNDPKTGKKSTYTEKSTKIKDGKKLNTVKRASSQAEAQRIAKAKLYEANKKEITAQMTVVGNTLLAAGEVIQLIGFGKFDGKYKITKATHTISSSGYETALELDNTNNPPKETEKTKQEKTKAEKKKKPKKAKISTNQPVKKNLTEDEKWIMSQK